MSLPVLSFRASGVDRDKLRDVLARHLAYEKARAFRSAVLTRLLLLVLAAWALSRGIHLLPGMAFVVAAGIAGAATVMVVAFEWHARLKLLSEVAELQ